MKEPEYLRPFGKMHMIKCPECGLEAPIDQDQFEGKVSIDCPECPYHETIDFKQALKK
jgi:predicted RNA-binding Zn-ribbon protein involved in translation (DUF1610 family)